MKPRITLLAALLPTPLLAHSGHGLNGGDGSLLHYLSEPEHVAGLVLLVAVVAAAIGWWRRRHRGKA